MDKLYFDAHPQEDLFTHRRASMALIIDILRASREIFYFSSILKRKNSETRIQLGLMLEHCGILIKEIFENLNQDQFPSKSCEQLELASHKLYFVLADILGSHQARVLSDRLTQTYRIELLYNELQTGVVDHRELVLLDEAANHFIHTAKLITE